MGRGDRLSHPLEKELYQLKLDNLRLRSELDRHTNLSEGYPQLASLYRVLAWIWLDAHPLTSTTSDLGTRIQSQGAPMPGAGTHKQRARHTRTQRLLLEWTERLENDLDGRPREARGSRPRCWAGSGKHKRGLVLPHGSSLCSVCGARLKDSEVARRNVQGEGP